MRLILFVIFFYLSPTIAEDHQLSISPSFIDDEFYSETFTLFSRSDNGEYIYAQIGISNIGPGDQNGFCRIMFYRPGKKTINKSILVEKSKWRYQDAPNPKLTVDACHLSLNKKNQLSFNGQIDNTTVLIHLDKKIEVSLIKRDYVKEEYASYLSEILVPWSQSSAKAKQLNGYTTMNQGFGYADHSISTFLPSNLASRWIRFRTLNQNKSHLLLARFPNESNKVQGWDWRKDSEPTELISAQQTSATLPIISVETTANKYAIKAEQLIYRQATLEEKGVLGMVLSKIIGNPVTYTYGASMQVENGERVSGVLTAGSIYSAKNLTLDADLSALLPDTFASVQDLETVKNRFGGIGYVVVTVRGDNPKAMRSLADEIANEPKTLNHLSFVDYRRPVDFFKNRALLLP